MLESNGKRFCFEVESDEWTLDEEMRLNASSFSPEAARARDIVDRVRQTGTAVRSLSEIAEAFYPTRFKRLYGTGGTQFLSSKDIFSLTPEGKKLVNYSPELAIKPGWLLITRSGSVGRAMLANEVLSKAAISEHVIRVVPKKDAPVGYIFAYLLTWIGQALLNRRVFGGVVQEIEPNHVLEVPVPFIDDCIVEIDSDARRAIGNLQSSQALLGKAVQDLLETLKLEEIRESDARYFGGQEHAVCRPFEMEIEQSDLRLDASFHSPLFRLALERLSNCKEARLESLGNLAESFVPPRFRRLYVDNPSAGIPLLQGTHIPQAIPQDVKYVSSSMPGLSKYRIRKNWVLVTCSGTVGRVTLVRGLWNRWAATNHLIRVIPDAQRVHPGYLTAFLLSDYGRIQMERLSYGGVIEEIGEAGELFRDIRIPIPNDNDQEKRIGEMVFAAFDLRDDCNRILASCSTRLEKALQAMTAADQ